MDDKISQFRIMSYITDIVKEYALVENGNLLRIENNKLLKSGVNSIYDLDDACMIKHHDGTLAMIRQFINWNDMIRDIKLGVDIPRGIIFPHGKPYCVGYYQNMLYVIDDFVIRKYSTFDSRIIGIIKNVIICSDGTIYTIMFGNSHSEFVGFRLHKRNAFKNESSIGGRYKLHKSGISYGNSFWIVRVFDYHEPEDDDDDSYDDSIYDPLNVYDISDEFHADDEISQIVTYKSQSLVLCENSRCYKISYDNVITSMINVKSVIDGVTELIIQSDFKNTLGNDIKCIPEHLENGTLKIFGNLSNRYAVLDGSVIAWFIDPTRDITYYHTGMLYAGNFKHRDWMEGLLKNWNVDVEFK